MMINIIDIFNIAIIIISIIIIILLLLLLLSIIIIKYEYSVLKTRIILCLRLSGSIPTWREVPQSVDLFLV